jgi:hypothetical protein
MATLTNTDIENKSYLSPIGFKFMIQKMPHVNYFTTSANIPDMTLGQIDTIDNTFIKLPVPGDKLTFGLLTIRFRVDEDLKNFSEVYDWMIGLGYPDNFQQRSDLQQGVQRLGEVYSDASLMITTAAYKPNIEVKFIDAYPVSVSMPEFNIEETTVTPMNADATFAYRKYELNNIK